MIPSSMCPKTPDSRGRRSVFCNRSEDGGLARLLGVRSAGSDSACSRSGRSCWCRVRLHSVRSAGSDSAYNRSGRSCWCRVRLHSVRSAGSDSAYNRSGRSCWCRVRLHSVRSAGSDSACSRSGRSCWCRVRLHSVRSAGHRVRLHPAEVTDDPPPRSAAGCRADSDGPTGNGPPPAAGC